MIRPDYFRVATRRCVLFAFVMLAGCATAHTRVDATHDPAADFSEFRTFGFAQPLGTDRRGRLSSLSAELTASTMRELLARGMQPVSSSPDLRINFFLAEQTGPQSRGSFAHSHSASTTWSGYGLGTSAAHQIVEGTLVIDIIDARRGALVFEGMADGRITESMRDNLRETVGEVVAEMLAKMP
jgi:hypothetical protein